MKDESYTAVCWHCGKGFFVAHGMSKGDHYVPALALAHGALLNHLNDVHYVGDEQWVSNGHLEPPKETQLRLLSGRASGYSSQSGTGTSGGR